MKNNNNQDTFTKEEQFLQTLKEKLSRNQLCKEEAYKIIEDAITNYEKLLADVKLLTRVSDRLQAKERKYQLKIQEQKAKIQKYNRELRRKNEELQKTIEELTKARAGRKATTIVLFLALILFFVSESLENLIDNWTQQTEWGNILSWILKGLIALTFKPIESGLEDYFVRKALMEKEAKTKKDIENTKENPYTTLKQKTNIK